ncbi:type II secretion system F family protein [Anaeromicropila populeti]|uniref:Tight adherence protein B n=1 Tax=Anaeromicropila populeti TaxID=37658 RepID=A0A1I6LS21_9FIRM|nr:type II secretion system F family protein [Anaeromicropila populeti]SFS06224.1 tight adherence protein B [Anaeromicropila populeti]
MLNLQFRDGILCLSNALNAGYSIENAFFEAVKDLKMIYPEEVPIIKEYQYMTAQIANNYNVEELLYDFAVRSGIEDIYNFSDVFSTAKRTGGNIIKIINLTSESINEKVEVQREIETLITAKKLEANIMSVVPIGIILYLWLFMPGFLEPLYQTLVGKVIMSLNLVAYLVAIAAGQKIMSIRM